MDLKNLEVWKQTRSFRIEISKIYKQFPSDEKYRLIDQLARSSRSVTANISEGHGRYHYQENIQFCRQARGSLVETYDHLTVAFDEGFIDQIKFEKLEKEIERLTRLLNGYISYLQKRKNENDRTTKRFDEFTS